jgi:serpin B
MNRPLVIAALLFTACESASPYQPREVVELTPALSSAVHGNNDFALDLHRQAREPGENLFFSPLSVSAALGMTSAGAAGQTEAEMIEVLSIEEPDTYHASFGGLMQDLSGDKGRGYQLDIANRLYGQDGFAFHEPFLAVTADDYGAPLETLDFGASEASRTTINDWVSDNTQGYIPDLLPQGFVNGDTRLVLVNAIYFQADWAQAFDKGNTRDETFHAPSGDVTASMMVQSKEFPYAEVDGAKVLELPYLDDEVSLLVVLPNEEDGLVALEDGLTSDVLEQWVAALNPQEVDVQLPGFELEHEIKLTEALKAMGMEAAFDPSTADFSGMADASLFITGTVHKAYVKVDEEGTTAAAATGVGAGITSMPVTVPFIADHPFLFLVRDRLTGSILFLGRITDPT